MKRTEPARESYSSSLSFLLVLLLHVLILILILVAEYREQGIPSSGADDSLTVSVDTQSSQAHSSSAASSAPVTMTREATPNMASQAELATEVIEPSQTGLEPDWGDNSTSIEETLVHRPCRGRSGWYRAGAVSEQIESQDAPGDTHDSILGQGSGPFRRGGIRAAREEYLLQQVAESQLAQEQQAGGDPGVRERARAQACAERQTRAITERAFMIKIFKALHQATLHDREARFTSDRCVNKKIALFITLSSDGTVTDVQLTESTGYLALDEYICTLVLKSRKLPIPPGEKKDTYTVNFPAMVSCRIGTEQLYFSYFGGGDTFM